MRRQVPTNAAKVNTMITIAATCVINEVSKITIVVNNNVNQYYLHIRSWQKY